MELVQKQAWLSPAWVAVAVRGMCEPRAVIRGALVQACSLSGELIWHRIWECGLGARARAPKKKEN